MFWQCDRKELRYFLKTFPTLLYQDYIIELEDLCTFLTKQRYLLFFLGSHEYMGQENNTRIFYRQTTCFQPWTVWFLFWSSGVNEFLKQNLKILVLNFSYSPVCAAFVCQNSRCCLLSTPYILEIASQGGIIDVGRFSWFLLF